MKLPRTVKVGVLHYEIKPVAHLSIKVYKAADERADTDSVPGVGDEVREIMGLTNPDEQIIAIESEVTGPDTQAAVMLHEIIHACLAQVGMRDTLTFEQEESVVKRLAPLLLQTLRDNRRLVEFLTGRHNRGRAA